MSEPSPAPSAGAQAETSTPPEAPRRSPLRRFAPLLAGLTVAFLLSPVAERWSSAHAVDVALAAPETIVEVSLVASHESDDLLATTWTFAAGAAPERLSTSVRGPEGDYVMRVEVTRSHGARESREHQVQIDGERRVILHTR